MAELSSVDRQDEGQSNTSQKTEALPGHINETVKALARLHAGHRENATPLQNAIDWLTASAASPRFIGGLTLLVGAWIAINLFLGCHAWDAPPFNWLQGIASVAALYITILILSTQRRDNRLSRFREQLVLELVILSEQKAAKAIELLEELRRDDPHIHNRDDRKAAAFAVPTEPEAVLDAIQATHDESKQSPIRPNRRQ